jgi:hypothetical protein
MSTTEALTPEAAGIRLNDLGFIEVDEHLETSVPGVYAMGDVKGGPGFTHLSYADSRILHANLIRHEKASTRDRIVPYTVFIDPQLGRVDMTEREAREQGRAIRVAKLPMSAVIRAIETGETRGFIKAVAPWRTRFSLARSWRKASTPLRDVRRLIPLSTGPLARRASSGQREPSGAQRVRRRSRRCIPAAETGDKGRPNGSMNSAHGPVAVGTVPSRSLML